LLPLSHRSKEGIVMRTFTVMTAATALLLTVVGPALADCRFAQPSQVGALLGDPEKDTFGWDCGAGEVERTGSLSRASRVQAVHVGVVTGETEKDTLGYPQAESVR
jgi:hypothetical protein